ncbi:glycosyl transferase [Parageobacillus toebii]|uniref:glycosyl transferase n=1 Tax=Parageobacillus toebii TaxID=153151 RepID=UPI00281502E8|nr:glycosyl transferase [Parageobacillus toebii]WMT20381.1 glycosyl transferase [Parageobacillus toebii]
MPLSVVKFDHLERMTDDTGLLEHSLGRIPRRREGYSTDDNARAIWVCMEWLDLLGDDESKEQNRLYRLLDRYLAFLLWAQREDGWFQNNFHFDRTPESESRSDDCLGRSLWAAAVAYVNLDDVARRCVAAEILGRALSASRGLRFLRGQAWALATCCLLLSKRRDGLDLPSGVTEADLINLADVFERSLLDAYHMNRTDDWRWYEPQITYANGLLPWALFVAYRYRGRVETLQVAKESLDFLLDKMSGQGGVIRPIGNRGWCSRNGRADWDQQPVDVMKLALAAREAYRVLGDDTYREVVRRCRDWFYGDNDLGVPLADLSDGSCCDGLNSDGPNPNRGAESTLSYLLTEAMANSLQLEVAFNESFDGTTIRSTEARV